MNKFVKKAWATTSKRNQPYEDNVEQKVTALSEPAGKKNDTAADRNFLSYWESPEGKTFFNPVQNESGLEC
jgi:hypothetical protein